MYLARMSRRDRRWTLLSGCLGIAMGIWVMASLGGVLMWLGAASLPFAALDVVAGLSSRFPRIR